MRRLVAPSLFVLLLAGSSLFAQDQDLDQKVLFFDGVDDFAEAPFLNFREFKDGFTVEAWHMNWTGYLLSQGAYGPENSVWFSTGHGFFAGCGWENEQESTDENFAQYVGLFRRGKWTHVAMVFDGKKQMVFVDGQLMGERLSPAPGILDEKRNIIIGAEPGPSDEDSWNFGSGFLRSLRVSSVPRYSSEFKPVATLESDDETVALFSSTSVKGGQLVDLSGNERHGKLHGPKLLSPDYVATRVIEGSVFDPDGDLAKGVIVLLQSNDENVAVSQTDDSGRYFFVVNNPKGEYGVEAGDWTRTVARRWASTMEGKVEGIKVDEGDRSQVDVKLKDTTPLAVGQVNESPSSEDLLKEASWLIGRWEADYDLPSGVPELGEGGEKVHEVLSWRWVLDKKFVIFRSRMKIEGKPTFTGLEVTGVDPESGRVTSSLFNSTGAQGHGDWQKEGDTFTLNWSVTQPDGIVYKGMSYIRQGSEDEYTWGMKNVTRAGKEISLWGPVTYKKRPSRQRRD